MKTRFHQSVLKYTSYEFSKQGQGGGKGKEGVSREKPPKFYINMIVIPLMQVLEIKVEPRGTPLCRQSSHHTNSHKYTQRWLPSQASLPHSPHQSNKAVVAIPEIHRSEGNHSRRIWGY